MRRDEFPLDDGNALLPRLSQKRRLAAIKLLAKASLCVSQPGARVSVAQQPLALGSVVGGGFVEKGRFKYYSVQLSVLALHIVFVQGVQHPRDALDHVVVDDVAVPLHVDQVEDDRVQDVEYCLSRIRPKGTVQDIIAVQADAGGVDGRTARVLCVTSVEVHENVGDHVHRRIVVIP